LIDDGTGNYVDYTSVSAYSALFSIDLGTSPTKWDTSAGTVTFSTSDYTYD